HPRHEPPDHPRRGAGSARIASPDAPGSWRPEATPRQAPTAPEETGAVLHTADSPREPGSPATWTSTTYHNEKSPRPSRRPRASFGAPEGPLSPEIELGLENLRA